MTVIPSEKVYSLMLQYINDESFFFDYDLSGTLILYLKLFPELATSIINGAQIEIVFLNPKIEENNITLYIYDILDAPFYFSKVFNEQEKSHLAGLSSLYSYFMKNNKIRLAIFDETIKNIFTTDLKFSLPSLKIESWYKEVVNNNETVKFDYTQIKKNIKAGYTITLEPVKKSLTTSPIHFNSLVKYNFGENAYIKSTNIYSEHYDIKNYLKTGTLGYLQEQNLKEILSIFFKPNLSLFPSPKLSNNEELTDIVFGIDRYVILLESKSISAYDGNIKSVSNKSRAMTKLINKASFQLIRAKKIIKENPNLIINPGLFEHCIFAKEIIKLCIINDTYIINEKSLLNSLKDYSKKDLPIIMSVQTFYTLLFKSKSPKEIVKSFSEISKYFIENEIELPIFKGFKRF